MLKIVILRFIREIRLMSILLLSMCLVTGFITLGPLYTQTLLSADFDKRVENARPQELSVTARHATPLDNTVPTIIDQTFSQYIGQQRFYATSGGFTCGFIYDESAPNNIGQSTGMVQCYRPYTYDDFNKYFTVIEGRFPQPSNTDIVEAIITTDSAQSSDYAIGDRIIIGASPENSTVVEFVGIVDIIGSNRSPFWQLQTIPRMVRTYMTPTDVRLDLSFAVAPQDFEATLVPITGNASYTQQFELQRETLSSHQLDDFELAFQTMIDELRSVHPDINVATLFSNTIAEYKAGRNGVLGPITLLSFLVFVLMIYNIVATASLINEQQSQEWSMMASRGGSMTQLLFIQFETNMLLGIIAALVGPLFGYLIMLILATIGPYAPIIEISNIGAIPIRSIWLSVIAATLLVVVLTIPAWTAANKSLSQLKSTMARAPKAPVWARYFIDVIVLITGMLFMLRLISLSTDEPLLDVLPNISILVGVFSRDSSSVLFSDPFNLAGPVLLLLGVSLLWLRIFPILVGIFGRLFANGNGLTARLAFWNVERDPAHYAQLVLMLIGTLSLGTASLALSETRTVGGWEAAQTQTGADIAVTINPAEYDSSVTWESFPTVIDAVPLMRIPTQNGALVALNPADVSADTFQAIIEPFTLLQNQQVSLSGLTIPDGTRQLKLDVYAREPEIDDVITTQVVATFEDQMGVRLSVPFKSDDPIAFSEFLTHQLTMPTDGVAPYRLLRLELHTTAEDTDEFDHVVIVDNLRVVATNDAEIVINSFEPDTYNEWSWSVASRGRQILDSTAFKSETDLKTEGEHSLSILHLVSYNQQSQRYSTAIMLYNDTPSQALPIVVSQNFANVEGQASRFRRPLEIGDSLSTGVNLPTSDVVTARADISYEIVGIVDNQYPSFDGSDRLIFVNFDTLRYYLNTLSVTSQYPGTVYDVNTIWLEIDEREPTPELINILETANGVERVDTAWVRFSELQRDPLTNAVTGILFAGFWVSLFLGLMDFGFYVAITIRRRALAFATLQAIGWNERNLLNLLLVEQIIFIVPAVLIGILFGVLLANIILPFLSLIGSLQLQFPIVSITLLIAVLIVGFAIILRFAAVILRRLSLNQVMRFGE